MMKHILRLLGFHFHEWRHLETHTIPGRVHDAGRVVYNVMRREIHFRRCDSCGKEEQYYP